MSSQQVSNEFQANKSLFLLYVFQSFAFLAANSRPFVYYGTFHVALWLEINLDGRRLSCWLQLYKLKLQNAGERVFTCQRGRLLVSHTYRNRPKGRIRLSDSWSTPAITPVPKFGRSRCFWPHRLHSRLLIPVVNIFLRKARASWSAVMTPNASCPKVFQLFEIPKVQEGVWWPSNTPTFMQEEQFGISAYAFVISALRSQSASIKVPSLQSKLDGRLNPFPGEQFFASACRSIWTAGHNAE